jgi:hypothetical protein
MPLFKPSEPSLEELQEREETLRVKARTKDLELTIAQKEAALKKLREAGLSGASFGWNWSSIKNWVRGR